MNSEVQQQRGHLQQGYVARGEEQDEEKEEAVGPIVFMARTVGGGLGSDVFLLDSGATCHMVDGSVPLLDERRAETMVRGVADVHAHAIGTLRAGGLEFTEVLKVQGLGINLISEGVLHSHGCDVVSSAKGGWKRVIYQGRVIIEATYEGELFLWRATIERSTAMCFMAGRGHAGGQQLWHNRMGHLNYADLDRLRAMSTGMDFSRGDSLGCVLHAAGQRCMKSLLLGIMKKGSM